MKYKVVKDHGNTATCDDCCFGDDIDGCTQVLNKHRLQDCIEYDCHFELDDTITDVDLREIDEANEDKNGVKK